MAVSKLWCSVPMVVVCSYRKSRLPLVLVFCFCPFMYLGGLLCNLGMFYSFG